MNPSAWGNRLAWWPENTSAANETTKMTSSKQINRPDSRAVMRRAGCTVSAIPSGACLRVSWIIPMGLILLQCQLNGFIERESPSRFKGSGEFLLAQPCFPRSDGVLIDSAFQRLQHDH